MSLGSTEAFGEFYERYAVRAFRVARGICPSAASAEEAVQDAFESVWKSRATYCIERGPAGPWAMAIVRYRALDIVRRRGFPLEWQERPDSQAAGTPVDQVIDDAVADDEARHLRDLLAQIPVAQREVVTLAFYGQLSHTEIAERLGLPAGTIKSRIRLGLEKLRVELDRTA